MRARVDPVPAPAASVARDPVVGPVVASAVRVPVVAPVEHPAQAPPAPVGPVAVAPAAARTRNVANRARRVVVVAATARS